MSFLRRNAVLSACIALLNLSALAAAQTYTSCNPLTQGGCPADTALGKSVSIDFSSGASGSFTSFGNIAYSSNGAGFTVAKSGDAPTITSEFYIMFGHIDYVIKAAPGVGIVSSAVMQSDCLDEIDWEWLGGDDTQVQSNYFGKGLTTSYNRGAFHGAPNNHDSFNTYSVDWTADQIVWSINGVTVRTLTPAEADSGQYPQTPMMIKVGAWSGGDPANPPGTISWAGGETDYSAGPFTMYLRSIHVADYSTGSQYTYSGSTGTWESIKSNGGTINSSGHDTPGSSVVPVAPAASATTYQPATSTAWDGTHAETTSTYVTPSVWPWVGSATATLLTSTIATVPTSYSGLPSGWTVNSSGKVVPPSAGTTTTVPVFVLATCFLAGLLIGFRP